MPSSSTTVSPRYMTWLLLSLGLLSCAVIVGTVLWLTQQLNFTGVMAARDIARATLDEKLNLIEVTVADYAHWNTAHSAVASRDEDLVYEALGSGATESEIFDELHILSFDLDRLYTFGSDEDNYADVAVTTEEMARLIDTLREADPSDYTSVTAFATTQTGPALISASFVYPDLQELMPQVPPEGPPILVGVQFVNTALLNSAALRFGHDNLEVSRTPPGEGRDGIQMGSFHGKPVAFLTWDKPAPGTLLTQQIWPGILIVCAAILLVCMSASRYFHMQNSGLKEARKIAETDALTGLLNRAGLSQLTNSYDFETVLQRGHLAVVSIDMNRFKDLNDRLGHAAGDEALLAMAFKLRASVRKSDAVVRLGGDEFLCLLFDEHPQTAAQHVVDRLRDKLSTPVSIFGEDVILEASVGTSIAHEGRDWDDVLASSDAAMYQQKRSAAVQYA